MSIWEVDILFLCYGFACPQLKTIFEPNVIYNVQIPLLASYIFLAVLTSDVKSANMA
jgi:hypothetical protein